MLAFNHPIKELMFQLAGGVRRGVHVASLWRVARLGRLEWGAPLACFSCMTRILRDRPRLVGSFLYHLVGKSNKATSPVKKRECADCSQHLSAQGKVSTFRQVFRMGLTKRIMQQKDAYGRWWAIQPATALGAPVLTTRPRAERRLGPVDVKAGRKVC
jgi:hypothetical protein